MGNTIGAGPKTPWHLWVVGLLSLLWNAGGAYDYVQSKTQNAEYLGQMADAVGVGVDSVIAYFNTFPLWADMAWALGVWGSVLGSILLLLRSRFAFHAFVVSLIGLIGGMGYQFSNPLPGAADLSMTYVFTAIISAIILLLIWYSRRMTAAGALR